MAHKYLKAAGMAAMVLGGSFVPAQAFTLGWNSAVCIDPDVTGVFPIDEILAINADGSVLTAASNGNTTSQQNELLFACRNGTAGYSVFISNTSTNAFIGLSIPIAPIKGPASPPPHPGDLAAVIKQNGGKPQAASGLTPGVHDEICSTSYWVFNNTQYYVIVTNVDGSSVYETTKDDTADPIQTQLVEACRNGQTGKGYTVQILADGSIGVITVAW